MSLTAALCAQVYYVRPCAVPLGRRCARGRVSTQACRSRVARRSVPDAPAARCCWKLSPAVQNPRVFAQHCLPDHRFVGCAGARLVKNAVRNVALGCLVAGAAPVLAPAAGLAVGVGVCIVLVEGEEGVRQTRTKAQVRTPCCCLTLYVRASCLSCNALQSALCPARGQNTCQDSYMRLCFVGSAFPRVTCYQSCQLRPVSLEHSASLK